MPSNRSCHDWAASPLAAAANQAAEKEVVLGTALVQIALASLCASLCE
jgi:hypothetical protein